MRRPNYSSILLLYGLVIVDTNAASSTNSVSLHNPFTKKKVSKFDQLRSFVLPRPTKRKRSKSSSSSNNNSGISNNGNNNNSNKKNRKKNADTIRIRAQNLMAGLASAIALIPEASTFAMTAGLSPLVGLGSTIIMATCSGALGGRPGLVSGASATVSMILKPLCEQEGHLMVGLAVIMAGLIQIALGMASCGKYIRVVPRPVMLGFVNVSTVEIFEFPFDAHCILSNFS